MELSKYSKSAFDVEELNDDGSSNLAEQLRSVLRKDFTTQLRQTMIELVNELNSCGHRLEEDTQEGEFKDSCVLFEESKGLTFAIDTSVFYTPKKT